MINSMFQLFIDELNYIENSSYFASQSVKNQSDCGGLVEFAIRKFLREIIGERFKITHGYIYSPVNKMTSPQIDIIITDKLVPHTLKCFEYLDNLEIVPIEAVVAIFEVKRTLNSDTLKAAGNHLKKIFDDIGLLKDRPGMYMPGGVELKSENGVVITGGKTSNPLLGIIGLLHEGAQVCSKLPWCVDTVYSFQGFLRAPKNHENDSLKVFSHRTATDQINYKEYLEASSAGRIKLLKGFVAYLLQHLNETSGRVFDMNAYFTC